jgi:long-chain fatty acid transport protein
MGGDVMRKAILASALLGAVSLSFATNGDNLIGVSPASRGMGGIGVGMPVGPTDTIFRNPAWMTYYKGFNMSFGGILFFPEVKARARYTPLFIDGSATSKSKMFVVPEVGIVNQINDKLTFGIGAFGVSGMGVDYRNEPNLFRIHTTFQFMRIIPAIAYKVNDAISISGALHLAYGSLDIGATIPGTPPRHAGGGQSQTYGIGAQLGVAYNMGNFVYAGLTYQSPVSMTYKRVFDSNCLVSTCDGQFEDLKLTQPQELAFGVGVKPMDNLKVGMDIRWINWKNAKGYKYFQWRDQWVIALGGEFKPTQKLALRAGYNYGRSPIRGGVKNTDEDFLIAMSNLIGFPAITEHHITLGLGYEFTKNFGIDLAYKHAFNKKVRAEDGSGNFVEAQNAQNAISIGLNWKF